MNDDAGWFVDDDEIGVLVEDRQRDVLSSDGGGNGWCHSKFDSLTDAYCFRPLGDDGVVDRYTTFVDETSQRAATHLGEEGCEGAVETYPVEREFNLCLQNVLHFRRV